MRTNGEITRVADALFNNVNAGLANLTEVKKPVVEKLIGADIEENLDTIGGLVSAVEAVIGAPTEDGAFLPKFLSKCEYNPDNGDAVTVSIRSRLKASVKYSRKLLIPVDENLVSAIGKFYVDCLFNMYYLDCAKENVDELNAKLEEICAENDIPYTFGFDVVADSDSFVLDITDDHVTFIADVSAAHDISTLGLFRGGDEYEDLVYNKTVTQLVDSLKALQTTAQLVKGNLKLVKTVSGVSTKKRANKLIRGSYHRQAKFLSKVKTGVGYFDETVTIDGNNVEVFALVNKAEDGTLSVVLSPFDVKTQFRVDYDVLAALEA